MNFLKKIKIHWPSALLSILLALTVWFSIAGRERVETWMNVRLELKDVPDGYVLLNGNTLPGSVEVRLRGPSGLIRNLTGQNIPMLISLSGVEPGHNLITLTGSDIPISGAFDIMEIRPQALEVDVDVVIEKDVKLTARSTHTPPKGVTKLELIPTQSSIHLKGPKTLVDKINQVEALVSLPAEINQREMTLPSYISLPQGVEATPPQINVLIKAEGQPQTINVQRSVSVDKLELIPPNLSIKPTSVTITLNIPFDWNEKNPALQQVLATVELPENAAPDKPTRLAVKVSTPEQIKFIEVEPKSVTVKLDSGTD